MSAKLTSLLRSKVRFSLVNGATELTDPPLYPFRPGLLPILCDSLAEEPKPQEAYERGFKSLVFEQQGSWLKAKGVGARTTARFEADLESVVSVPGV